MISIRNSLSELEKYHQERLLALDCYESALRNLAHYTLELDSEITEPYRGYLLGLAQEVSKGGTQALSDSQATLRGLLRDFRDKASGYLNNLREELSGTARALEEILDSLSQSEGDHESQLRKTVKGLREAGASAEGGALQSFLRTAAESIEQSLEQMQKQHQLAVAQFQVEIRMLHKRIDTLEAACSIDQLTRLFSRHEIEERVRTAPPGYCLLLARVSGFRLAEVQFSKETAAELAGAFVKRLRNSLPPNATIGRWNREALVAIISAPKTEVMALGKWIGEHLAGSYACLNGGKTVRPAIQLSIGIVDTVGSTPARVLERMMEFFPME
jgi:GGDEF domain-containing protein